jgi:hypothetical protein
VALFRRKHEEDIPPPGFSDAREGDALVLQQLADIGSDLSKPRDARFYLYVHTESDAEEAADALRSDGFTTEVGPAASPSAHPWLVLASRDMVVDAPSIAAARERFDALAHRYDGDYDGWEAAAD